MGPSAVTLVLFALLPAAVFCRSLSAPGEDDLWEKYPEEGDFFQGDIILLPGQLGKNGIPLDIFRWPNATIFYKLEGVFESNNTKKELVMEAIADYHNRTCIVFEPYDGTQEDYVVITDIDSPGCSSFVGRIGGKQTIDLKVPGCDKVSTIIHELMHAVGFFHEQSRMDRDDYVEIIWENIELGKEFNFMKLTSTPYGVSYDYGSILHYSATAFSSNGNATIVPKDPEAEIGQRKSLSDKDVTKINAMYNCTLIEQ